MLKCSVMAGTEIRSIAPDDVSAHRRLMAQAFGQGRVVKPPDADAPPESLAGQWGLFENGALRAGLTIVPYQSHWGGAAVETLALGGIAGVATFADARGQGHVDALLKNALAAMRDAGQCVSALYPFSWGFYRRYGWEWVGERRKVTIPLRELRSCEEGRNVSLLEVEKPSEVLSAPYTDWAKEGGYRGLFSTATRGWDGLLRHNDDRTTYAYVYREPNDAVADGYLLWRYDSSGEKGSIREFVARTPRAFRGLLSLLHHLGTQCATAHVTLPADSPLWAHVMHWELKTTIEPVFMARVVDVGAALSQIAVTDNGPNGTATLSVRDEHAPWNTGLWRITVEGGRVQAGAVPNGSAGEADVQADIQAFSQAFWGQPSLSWLRRAGRIDVTDEAGFALLARVLPAAPVFTLDDF